jgi:hypothetical protein
VLGYHFHVTFGQFCGEIKYKVPQEGGNSCSLSIEEDGQ